MSIAVALEKARTAHRNAIEQLYEDVCTVYEYRHVKDSVTKLTEMKEVQVLEDQPCKLSFESMDTTSDGVAAGKSISVKLFLSPDVTIKAGSKIVVTHRGEMTAYSNSGVPGRFATHQEIKLELFERWA